MENAVDALKMAFGVLIFIIAITVTFSVLSQAKATSDDVLFSNDKTNYYRYDSEKDESIVNVDTVISALYRSRRDGRKIIIKKSNNDIIGEVNINTNLDQINKFIENTLIAYENKEFKETFTEEGNTIIITYTEHIL